MRRAGLSAIAATLLAGCATQHPDSLAQVRKLAGEPAALLQPWQGEDAHAAARASVEALLAKPVDADAAVRLAMLHNRSVQASLAQLGIAEADLAQAGRIANPGFTLARKRAGDDVEYERRYGIDILGVLTLPWRRQLAEQEVQQTQFRVAGEVVRLALQTRKAWINAVAAAQLAGQMGDLAESEATSAELAKRMQAAGNSSQLVRDRAHLAALQASAELARARQGALAAREQLVRLLGLSGAAATALQLPDKLPELPAQPRNEAELGGAADKRLDLQMARQEVASQARALGLSRVSRWVNVLETSYLDNHVGGHSQHGYELTLELPLFDWGEARVAKAEAIYRQALNRAAQIGIDAESELRVSHAAYRSAYKLALQYRDQMLPLRQAISEQQQLRYNGMLSSVFELMQDSREQLTVAMASIEAQRAFWEADAELDMAISAGSIDTPESGKPAMLPTGSASRAH
ncbi:TolC family protein [Chitinimonas sp.]|uniref:TolC family protein n=1 Tax=Chitinimonas sp. TaxID=1934313 RepID=UPI0035B17A49